MHKTLASVVALAGLAAAGAVQAEDAVVAGDTDEPMELSLSQMDRLTAGGDSCAFCYQSNFSVVYQSAAALSSAYSVFGSAYSEAEAENEAEVEQENEIN
jgi:hypothetical protein